jgi:hypothetical protein
MEKKIMVLIIILGLASLAAAQTNPQNIINAKTSEGYYALYLIEGVISADVLWQISNFERLEKEIIQQQTAGKNKAVLPQSDLSKLNSDRSRKSKQGTYTESRYMRTVYNWWDKIIS